jgi:hypothetical protein
MCGDEVMGGKLEEGISKHSGYCPVPDRVIYNNFLSIKQK